MTTLKDLKNAELKSWLQGWVDLCKPTDVYICNGSKEEYDSLCDLMVKTGTFIKLKTPANSYLARSDKSDVARVEERTFICSKTEKDAGVTNHWKETGEMMAEFNKVFDGAMQGRTMYVIPFSMGNPESPLAKYGIEITDSPYVVVNMIIMTRVSQVILDRIDAGHEYVHAVHSNGAPLADGQADVPWPCAPVEKKYISQFPEERKIISFGSGYGGNALLGKKCFALRIATVLAREEGWMAEHMLILKLTSPEGEVKYVTGAFPSACGKTNLAMLTPTIPGWKVETVGDDIAWMRFNEKDGMLHAINPEAGFFGVAPGTSMKSNPNAMKTINGGNTIFTNVALTEDYSYWWEDGDVKDPGNVVDWLRRPWNKANNPAGPAAHKNSRFTTPARQCPVIAPEWEDPEGVPISAILFGGRRKTVVPLVNESLSWEHGVFMGATMSSEMTAATLGGAGQLRFDPMAMLPFIGYNACDYFQHWLDMAKHPLCKKLPKIYYVNWFRRGEDGHFLWPGYGDNSRVLKWIFERCDGKAAANETAIGNLPTEDAIDMSGLNVSAEDKKTLLSVDTEGWKATLPQFKDWLDKLNKYGNMPKEIFAQFEELKKRLG
ncbi:MAG: phosphoenolpyruvate carboxykinase (GTP) [Kiritimatiellae bacterium]|nr:phosphoenolpyruvate carboxykinase (GTP) [Kiritimatiellia bacterium]